MKHLKKFNESNLYEEQYKSIYDFVNVDFVDSFTSYEKKEIINLLYNEPISPIDSLLELGENNELYWDGMLSHEEFLNKDCYGIYKAYQFFILKLKDHYFILSDLYNEVDYKCDSFEGLKQCIIDKVKTNGM